MKKFIFLFLAVSLSFVGCKKTNEENSNTSSDYFKFILVDSDNNTNEGVEYNEAMRVMK